MGDMVGTAVLLGGKLVAPEHTVMQRLAERRITVNVISIFDIQPNGNGWKYPIPNGGYRWKNADSNAAEKYLWPDGKPESANFYHAQDLASAINSAGGSCWFVSGEADVWAMQSAGITHVMSGYTESTVSQELPSYLESMGVTVLYVAPDLDSTGARWARLIVQILQDSTIEIDARQLPTTLGDKGDIGKAWVTYTKARPFERWLLGLPRFTPEAEPISNPKTQSLDASTIPTDYKDLIAKILGVVGFKTSGKGKGFSSKNICCPFHNDEHPSASLHIEKGLYCHACGDWFSWNETGIKIGAGSLLEWRLSNTYAVSTELREALIKDNKTSLARFLDVASIKGWQAGKEFTIKDAVNICNGVITEWTIRQAIKELSYLGFLPSFFYSTCKKENNRNKSRPPKVYRLPSLAELTNKLQVSQYFFDEMPLDSIKIAADYRAEVYAALPRRKPGQYTRKTLVRRIGISTRTSQSYDKRAGLLVTKNIRRQKLSPDDIAGLPDKVFKNRKYNIWLENEFGKRYKPDKESIKLISDNGGGKVYLVEQFANSYGAGKISRIETGDTKKV